MHIQMFKLIFSKSVASRRRFFLLLAWLSGLISGLYLSQYSYHAHYMHLGQFASFVITGNSLLVSVFAPAIISYVIVRYLSAKAILPLAFLKAFIFSFTSCCISFLWGSAGWLVWFLFFSSDAVLIILLMFFWIRNISNARFVSRFDVIFLFSGAALIFLADYFFLLPLIAKLSAFI